MIDVFHASDALLAKVASVKNERELLRLIQASLTDYQYATCAQHTELDIAFTVTGGPATWQDVTAFDVPYSPEPERNSAYGDILVEKASEFVHLATPAGFIPLVDVVVLHGQLSNKRVN